MKQDTSVDEPTEQVRRAQQLVDMASFVRGLSNEAAKGLEYVDTVINVSVNTQPDPSAMVVLWAEAGERHGVPVSRWVLDEFAGVRIPFGFAHLDVYAKRDQICPRPAPGEPRRWPESLTRLPFIPGRPGDES